MEKDFYKSVVNDFEKHFYDFNNKKVLIGLSGGADSVGLLLWFCEYAKNRNIKIKAVHINHNIRPNAVEDERLCEAICNRMNVEFESVAVDVINLSKENKLGLEEMGRIIRRDIYEKICSKEGYDYIALGHHIEDRCETILHNIIRGTGLDGLVGIKYVSGKYIRPLLFKTKDEIISYVKFKNFKWAEDETNKDESYTRNYIRLNIMPSILKINPNAYERISNMAENVSNARDALNSRDTTYEIKIKIKSKLESIYGSSKDITSKHINSVEELTRNVIGKRINLPGGVIAIKTEDDVLFEKYGQTYSLFDKEILKKDDKLEIFTNKKFETKVINLDRRVGDNPFLFERYTRNNPYTKYIDYDQVKKDLEFRTRNSGDYISLKIGETTKLKKYYIDAKIPRQKRNVLPVVAIDSEIIWVVGYRMNVNYQITPNTRNILEIKYINNIQD